MASTLTNISDITDSGTLELAGASYVTTALVGDVTYVMVASRVDDGVSVFSLAADGTLTPVFDFADNAQTNLGGAFALTSVVVGGTTYLYTSGPSAGRKGAIRTACSTAAAILRPMRT